MTKTEIKLILDGLKLKREEQTREIDKLIKEYEAKLAGMDEANSFFVDLGDPTLPSRRHSVSISYNGNSTNIPTAILELIEQDKRPLKTSEIEEKISSTIGKEANCREYLRSLHKKNKIVLVKINNSNKNSYWIKKEWFDKEGGEIKSGFDGGFRLLYDNKELKFIE